LHALKLRGKKTMAKDTEGGFLVTQVKQISGRIFEKLLMKAGIEAFNGAQGRILYVIWQEDGIPIMELARKTGLAKTTLTSMLDRMEEADLIVRKPSQLDKRRIHIFLTETSRSLNHEYNKVCHAMNEIYYAGFSDEEITAFENNLKRILSNLNGIIP